MEVIMTSRMEMCRSFISKICDLDTKRVKSHPDGILAAYTPSMCEGVFGSTGWIFMIASGDQETGSEKINYMIVSKDNRYDNQSSKIDEVLNADIPEGIKKLIIFNLELFEE